jgi:hypothetical protein
VDLVGRIFKASHYQYILIVPTIFLWGYIQWIFTRGMVIPSIGDFQRDTAITLNILGGNIFGDASYLGEHAWYPFLSHFIYAIFHKLTNISVLTLYISYPFILTIPTIFLFLFMAGKIFKNWSFAFLSLFTFVFIIPWTSHYMSVVTHPNALAFGTLSLSIYLFWRASTSERILDWIIAGLGIALVIYSQPFAAMTVCGSIVLYQLWTHRFWKNFFIMAATAFIFASPYILPFLTVYHFQSRNAFQIQVLPELISLDNIFYGFGNIRWVNCLFIISGIIVAFFRRNSFDKFVLSMYTLGTFFLLLGLDRFLGEQYGFPVIKTPQAITWNDMWIYSHFPAVLLFSMGVWYYMEKISHMVRAGSIKICSILFVIFIVFYGYFSLSVFIARAHDWHANRISEQPYTSGWLDFVDWSLHNTSIDDVFLGSPDPTAYVFVSGMTGRKVVATNNDHVNPFVDQPKRIEDTMKMYRLTDISEFKKLAKEYKVAYVVISSYEQMITKEGLTKFSTNAFFQLVFSNNTVSVYRLAW